MANARNYVALIMVICQFLLKQLTLLRGLIILQPLIHFKMFNAKKHFLFLFICKVLIFILVLFFYPTFFFILSEGVIILLFILFILIVIAFYTLAERKIMAGVQRRRGPDVVGFWGILQPIADAVKLLNKEPILPIKSNHYIFIVAPLAIFLLSLTGWAVIPFTSNGAYVDKTRSLLVIFAISSLNIFSLIMAG